MNKKLPIPLTNRGPACRPASPNRGEQAGFTLIELMVVVAIIAILSVLGISIYSSAQKNARDGVRRSEISSLGKTIESSKDPVIPAYIYDDTNYQADYPQNKPRDPAKSASAPLYCVATSTGASPVMPPNPTTWGATNNCPTDVAGSGYTAWVTLVDSAGVYNTAATNLLSQSGGARYFKVCARLEVSGLPYCVTNIQ